MTDTGQRTQLPRPAGDRDDERARFDCRVRKIIDENRELERKPAK